MCKSFDVSEMPSMSRLHGCVELSLYPSWILIKIGLISG